MELHSLTSEVNQTFIKLKLNATDVNVERHFVSRPVQWILEIHGTPLKRKFAADLTEGKKLSQEDAAAFEKEEKERRIRASKINPIFQRGENAFRKNLYDEAVSLQRSLYAREGTHRR